MEHPELDNHTRFGVSVLHLDDENGHPLCCVVVKATMDILRDSNLTLAADQDPPRPAPQYWGDPENASLRHESETAFVKPTTDVVLIAHAYAPGAGATAVDVAFRAGTVARLAHVFGDRYWVAQGGSVRCTRPKPFEKIALNYENAFGGWDRSDPNPAKHSYEPRNPVGTGFGKPLHKDDERLRLPNIEDPQNLIRAYGQVVEPFGFGFVAPHWAPRASLAGSFDDAWDRQRKPLLPADFDRRFFNAASSGLIAAAHFRGAESISVVNAAPVGRLDFRLPGFPPPVCTVKLRGGRRQQLETMLDTVIVNTDEMKLILLWRNFLAVRNGPYDVAAIQVDCDHPAARRRMKRPA